ncbi:RNA degradosome polyphosphate kinase [Larkinella knui]|uniref:Polyphosphate kinase n=1 Tax=Larkinella knui TaxID=2025310 RepID=A0A3P1CM07_9BACT|nr:polyphosphate kinase 1 [Larkinella knui]RRB14106.1 polyphosphate kinase 1 [Larkinella knui]
MSVPFPPLYFNRDLSWLNFNHRVLLEAANPDTPLYERIRFLAIFSSNLDEFSRVRMPGLLALGSLATPENDGADTQMLPLVQETVYRDQEAFGQLLNGRILPELRQNRVHLLYGEPLPAAYEAAVTDYFFCRVLAFLQPVWLDQTVGNPLQLPDNALYFAVSLSPSATAGSVRYALLNIPRSALPRFFKLPSTDDQHPILFLDDVIRQHLPAVFPGYTIGGCYSIKINRNADVSIADEFTGEMDENIARMLEQRKVGLPTRFLYDASMPAELLNYLATYFTLTRHELIAGGRYHTLSDLAALPDLTDNRLSYPPQPPLPHPDLQGTESIFARIERRDYLLHPPYHSYNAVLRFFNEAAIDPFVQEIHVTLYRVASESLIVNALISAAKNGKNVTVFVELKARFDEANNLKWGKRLKAAGVRLVYSIPSLKVHAKTALVKRQQDGQSQLYGILSTGNFNESTARFYTDHVLLTTHRGLTDELAQLFTYLQSRQQPAGYPAIPFKHLLVAPFNLMHRFMALIDREIAHQRAGRPARIIIKLNNLQEKTMIDKLYEASQAGVPIDLIVRAICTLVPGVSGLSEHITVRRIVDRYLEHGRVFIFHNNGQPETYLGSADWMNRNLYRRVEVCFPVYDPFLQTQIRQLIDCQLADTVQARFIDRYLTMQPIPASDQPVRSQVAIYRLLQP